MKDLFDIQRALDTVLRSGRLTELIIDGDDPVGSFDGAERDILVQGALTSLSRVRGEGALAVEGDLTGDVKRPMRIEMGDDVIVTGSIRYATIRAARVLVGGDVHRVHITAAQSATVGGVVHGGRFVSGDYEGSRKAIESLRRALRHGRDELEALKRRVMTDEKRLDKTCRALRIPLDFSVGRLVRHTEGRVLISLDAFYESVEERPHAEVERAFNEFFTRGIVGVIIRRNRKYLVNYPAREKVFLQLVQGLRSLFRDVMHRDHLGRRVADMETRLQQEMDDLGRRRSYVDVFGGVAGDTEMEFILPQVVPVPRDDGFDFAHRSARLDIRPLRGAGAEIVSHHADGKQTAATLTRTEMGAMRFHVDGGRVVWDPAEAAAFA